MALISARPFLERSASLHLGHHKKRHLNLRVAAETPVNFEIAVDHLTAWLRRDDYGSPASLLTKKPIRRSKYLQTVKVPANSHIVAASQI